jgi:hypothetical protein
MCIIQGREYARQHRLPTNLKRRFVAAAHPAPSAAHHHDRRKGLHAPHSPASVPWALHLRARRHG